MAATESLPGAAIARNVLDWARLHAIQAVPAPPFRLDSEQARHLKSYLDHLDVPFKKFRSELEELTGHKRERPNSFAPATWQELHGSSLYGVRLEITDLREVK